MPDPIYATHHLVPTWDIGEHRFGLSCKCGAYMDVPGSMIHYAFDGREEYEPGGSRRKH